jgi:Transcriptional regulator
MIIDTLQIKYFLEVAKHLNFTKAANKLYVSQPAISRKVASLEKELDVVLIDRSNRELKLTKEGEEFQKFFSKYIEELETIILKTRKKKDLDIGEIHIGIFEGWDLSNFLRVLLKEFRLKYENIEIIIDTGREEELIKGLKIQKFDAIILLKITIEQSLKNGHISDVLLYDFLKTKKNVLYSSHNILTKKENLSLIDFKDQTLYSFNNELMPLDIVTNKILFKNYGFNPKIKMLSSIDAVINAVSTGNGYAILDNLMRIIGNNEFNHLELDEYHVISIVMLAESKNKINDIFLDYCKRIHMEYL